MAGMWRAAISSAQVVVLSVILSSVAPVFSESTAQAGFLENGVRPSGSRLKTIRPPGSRSRDRLRTIEERQSAPAKSRKTQKKSRKQQYAWFWKEHSPALGAASPKRWDLVLGKMTQRRAKGQGIHAAETLAAIDLAYRRKIAGPARTRNLSEVLILAVIAVESRGQPQARSPKGAQGLMQLIPATAKRFGVADAYAPAQNIAGGAAYLDWLLKEFNGDPLLALAGYNAGEGAVRKHKGVPPYRETRDYVVKVMDAAAAAAPICAAPISSPRTPCKRRVASPSG